MTTLHGSRNSRWSNRSNIVRHPRRQTLAAPLEQNAFRHHLHYHLQRCTCRAAMKHHREAYYSHAGKQQRTTTAAARESSSSRSHHVQLLEPFVVHVGKPWQQRRRSCTSLCSTITKKHPPFAQLPSSPAHPPRSCNPTTVLLHTNIFI